MELYDMTGGAGKTTSTTVCGGYRIVVAQVGVTERTGAQMLHTAIGPVWNVHQMALQSKSSSCETPLLW